MTGFLFRKFSPMPLPWSVIHTCSSSFRVSNLGFFSLVGLIWWPRATSGRRCQSDLLVLKHGCATTQTQGAVGTFGIVEMLGSWPAASAGSYLFHHHGLYGVCICVVPAVHNLISLHGPCGTVRLQYARYPLCLLLWELSCCQM